MQSDRAYTRSALRLCDALRCVTIRLSARTQIAPLNAPSEENEPWTGSRTLRNDSPDSNATPAIGEDAPPAPVSPLWASAGCSSSPPPSPSNPSRRPPMSSRPSGSKSSTPRAGSTWRCPPQRSGGQLDLWTAQGANVVRLAANEHGGDFNLWNAGRRRPSSQATPSKTAAISACSRMPAPPSPRSRPPNTPADWR